MPACSKDLFSGQSESYATYRPTYPDSLFEDMVKLVPERSLAWDVACGSGQATKALSKFFNQVIGTDLSQSQLDHAEQQSNIKFFQCNAENDEEIVKSTLGDISTRSVDLITVAQALHWFNIDKFFVTAKKFLKPEGLIAVWTYTWPEFPDSPHLTKLLRRMANEILGKYWAPERKIVDNQYRDIPFPFRKVIQSIEEPYIKMEKTWSLKDMIGYIRSWSAYQTAVKELNADPITDVMDEIKSNWHQDTYVVQFPIFLLAGKPQ